MLRWWQDVATRCPPSPRAWDPLLLFCRQGYYVRIVSANDWGFGGCESHTSRAENRNHILELGSMHIFYLPTRYLTLWDCSFLCENALYFTVLWVGHAVRMYSFDPRGIANCCSILTINRTLLKPVAISACCLPGGLLHSVRPSSWWNSELYNWIQDCLNSGFAQGNTFTFSHPFGLAEE